MKRVLNRLHYTLILIGAFLLLAVVVYAAVPNPGHSVSDIDWGGTISKLIANEICLGGDCRTSWPSGGTTTTTTSGWYVPSDVKVTLSNAPTRFDFIGDWNGYNMLYNWIQSNGCSGYHVCGCEEALRYAQTHEKFVDVTGRAWCISGKDDCGGFANSGGSSTGTVLYWQNNDWRIYPETSNQCGISLIYPVLCCK